MKINFLSEGVVSLLLLCVLGSFLTSKQLRMPMNVQTLLVIGLIMLFLIFAGLLWKERARDEREELHRERAGRLSFLVGLAVLVVAVVIQSFQYEIDPWLIYAIIAMLLSKIVARLYSQFRE